MSWRLGGCDFGFEYAFTYIKIYLGKDYPSRIHMMAGIGEFTNTMYFPVLRELKWPSLEDNKVTRSDATTIVLI